MSKRINIILGLVLVFSTLNIKLQAQCKDATIPVAGTPVLSDYKGIEDNVLAERLPFSLLKIVQDRSNFGFMWHFQQFYKSMVCYNEDLIARFMNEPLVNEFRDYINALEIEVVNGILKFKDPCCVTKLYDNLIDYSQRWDKLVAENPGDYQEYIESKRFPRDPMLFAFESITGFNSLRANIENQLLDLEAGEGISIENNPDNHFIVSEYERTLLTPDYEIIAGNTIFMYGEYQDIFITDLDFERLEKTKALWRLYGETNGTVKAVQLGLAEPIPEPEHKDGDGDCTAPCNQVKFTTQLHPTNKPGCNRFYLFKFYASFEHIGRGCLCDVQKVTWDFGDGTTAKDIFQPNHEYKQQGEYKVTLKVLFSNGVVCTREDYVNIKDCEVTINTPVKDNNYTGNGTRYIFTANATNCSGATPTYSWDFGDGETGTGSEIRHTYATDGLKKVSVTVTYSDGCTRTAYINLSINLCCRYKNYDDYSDRYRDFVYDDYGASCSSSSAQSKYWLRHLFTTRQCSPLWHRIVVKNSFYKKRANGKWYSQTAYQMKATFRGQITYDRYVCELKTIYPQGVWSTNKEYLTYDYAMHNPFWIGNKSIKSAFILDMYDNGGVDDNKTDVIELHENACNN